MIELVEIRWSPGGLWMRQRPPITLGNVVTGFGDFGPWKLVEGVKGDESDAVKWPDKV